MSHRTSLISALAVAAIVASLAACGGGDDGPNNGPSSPSQTFALLRIESISAIGDYIGTMGLDGQVFDLTDPAGCEAIQEKERAAASDEEREQIIADAAGRLCINRGASIVRDDQAAVTVQEYTTGQGWVLRMQQTDGVWEVTNFEALGGVEGE